MRRECASRFVPNDAITDISTFQGVVSIVLKDGQITREEKRLVIKLASLLNLDTDAPKRVYDAIVAGEKLEGGEEIGKTKCLEVYAGMFQTAYLNASISEDEYLVVAYLRHLFKSSEILGVRLNTYHNLFFYLSLVKSARFAIKGQRFPEFKKDFLKKYHSGIDGD